MKKFSHTTKLLLVEKEDCLRKILNHKGRVYNQIVPFFVRTGLKCLLRGDKPYLRNGIIIEKLFSLSSPPFKMRESISLIIALSNSVEYTCGV